MKDRQACSLRQHRPDEPASEKAKQTWHTSARVTRCMPGREAGYLCCSKANSEHCWFETVAVKLSSSSQVAMQAHGNLLCNYRKSTWAHKMLWNRYANAHCIVAQPHSEGKVPSCKENSSPSDIAAPALTCTNGGQAFKQHCLHKAPSTNAQCALMLNLTVVRNNKTAVRPSNGIC